MDDGWHGGGWGGGHWVGAIVMMVVFWGVIAAIVLAAIRSSGWHRHDHGAASARATSAHEAERILHERFARGEIDEAEYTRRHDLLRERTR